MFGKGQTTLWLLGIFSAAICLLLFRSLDPLNMKFTPISRRTASFKLASDQGRSGNLNQPLARSRENQRPREFKFVTNLRNKGSTSKKGNLPHIWLKLQRKANSTSGEGREGGKEYSTDIDFSNSRWNVAQSKPNEKANLRQDRQQNFTSLTANRRRVAIAEFQGNPTAKQEGQTNSDGFKAIKQTQRKREYNKEIKPTSASLAHTSPSAPSALDKNQSAKEVGEGNLATESLKETRPRVVLFYTTFFGSFPWGGLEDTRKFIQFQGKPCRVQNCVLSYDKQDFSSSDVVVFHGRNLPSVLTLRELHSNRPPHQAWGFFLLESPPHSPDVRQYDGLFNWTITYRRDSDIYNPYGFFEPLRPHDEKPQESVDYSLGKDKLIVWTVSNCAGKRFSYVHKLQQFVQVDLYGACGSRDCPKKGGRITEECVNLLRSYKFQLAFENTECLDYVTEKYWGSPLDHGIVPIVMGGADYKEIAIPGSYINVLDFPSVKALADYLLYLDKNVTAYNEYFRWKRKFKVAGDLHSLSSRYHWTCDLCALANNASSTSKVYRHLEDFWSVKQCERFSEQFGKLIYH